jgi:hypothetical protein
MVPDSPETTMADELQRAGALQRLFKQAKLPLYMWDTLQGTEALGRLIKLVRSSSEAMMERDAARYRWLRKRCQYGFEDRDGPQLVHRNGETGPCQNPRWREELDAAIDAEMTSPSGDEQ